MAQQTPAVSSTHPKTSFIAGRAQSPDRAPVRVKAHKVAAGMVVSIRGEEGVWTVLSRHPKGGWWWVHRWVEKPGGGEDWQTSAAHYGHMEQVITQ